MFTESNCVCIFSSQTRATCLAHLTTLIYDEDYELWSSLLRNFLRSSLNVRDEVAGSYKTKGKITVYVFSC
jgi:hypothetical protein